MFTLPAETRPLSLAQRQRRAIPGSDVLVDGGLCGGGPYTKKRGTIRTAFDPSLPIDARVSNWLSLLEAAMLCCYLARLALVATCLIRARLVIALDLGFVPLWVLLDCH